MVVIAHQDRGCPHRARAFRYVHSWYVKQGFRVVHWGGGGRDFTRARAINAAIRSHTVAPIVVQSDPDSLVPLTRLQQAIEAARRSEGLVVPHNRYLYTSREAVARIYDGKPWQHVQVEDCDTVGPDGLGNVVVFSRATWRKAGCFDERFGLWGGDDAAFAYATTAFCGPVRRLSGDMVHLWHPRLPQSDPSHPAYVEQFAILATYRDAAAVGPAAVRRLVWDRRRPTT